MSVELAKKAVEAGALPVPRDIGKRKVHLMASERNPAMKKYARCGSGWNSQKGVETVSIIYPELVTCDRCQNHYVGLPITYFLQT